MGKTNMKKTKEHYEIDYNSFYSVKSSNKRVRFLVLHYTATNFSESVKSLTGPYVSAHYLIPDETDPTYHDAGFQQLRIFRLVEENERAWHAGVSSWRGRTNLNDSSIGIEIVNQATDNNGSFIFPPFTAHQIEALKQLALNILQRYPDITPVNVIGHSDIAPGRKSDPGASFPWQQLYKEGIGAWYDHKTKQKYLHQFKCHLPAKAEIVSGLEKYGYDVSGANNDAGYTQLIRAFQLHFRPENYDGQPDRETIAILYALNEKYK